jgi:probable HAF family extracellular repeat protein
MGLSNAGRASATPIYTHVARLFIPPFYPSLSPRIACPVSSGTAENLANGINNHGLVVGDSFTDSSFTGGTGWTWDGSKYSQFNAPGSVAATGGTGASGVNDAGQVVGFYTDSSGTYHGYVKTGSSFTALDYPGASQYGGTVAYGINNAGVVTGFYFDDGSGDEAGFIWNNGMFATLNVPGALDTIITSINDRGELAGDYVAANGTVDGFVAYAVPEPGTLIMPGMGLSGVCLWRGRRLLAVRPAADV